MIFASDLDRTLVFSKKNFLKDQLDEEIVYIDVDDSGKEISFTTSFALGMLKEISNKCEFIPITAREPKQFNRIRFKEYGVNYRFAVLGNGAIILENGIENKEWSNKVREIRDKIDVFYLNSLLTNKFPDVKIRERTFGFEIFDKGITKILLDITSNFEGLRVEEDHRRSYIMFDGISKLNALHFIKKELKYNYSVVSGDSIMDLPMILDSDVGIVCSTGELVNYKDDLLNKHSLTFTKSTDQSSAEEVLQVVKGYLNI